jgi:hypothetical protein
MECSVKSRNSPNAICRLPFIGQKVLSEISEAIKNLETMFGDSFFRPSDQLLNADLFQRQMNRFP